MRFKIPCLKTSTHPEILPSHRDILFDENKSRYLLEGECYALLIPYLIEGVHSTDEIVTRLESLHPISASEIYYALLQLEEKGFLEEAHQELPKSTQALS